MRFKSKLKTITNLTLTALTSLCLSACPVKEFVDTDAEHMSELLTDLGTEQILSVHSRLTTAHGTRKITCDLRDDDVFLDDIESGEDVTKQVLKVFKQCLATSARGAAYQKATRKMLKSKKGRISLSYELGSGEALGLKMIWQEGQLKSHFFLINESFAYSAQQA